MKVLGLMVTLQNTAKAQSVCASLSRLPGVSVGNTAKGHLAAVLEADTTAETDHRLEAIEHTPGVGLVRVVGTYWDAPEGDEDHRLRGRKQFQREPSGGSLKGDAR